jgi:hypothetical protein
MTTKPYSCWQCAYFKADDPEHSVSGRCHRYAPHALDYYGFSGIEIESPLTDKGDIFVHDATEDTRLAVGSDGQMLYADSSEPTGLRWDVPPSGASPLMAKGDIFGYGAADARIPVGSNGQILYADSTQALGVRWDDPPAGTSPLTTKGDLFGYGAADARIPVGSDGQILYADSTQALGVRWDTPAAGSSPLTTKGDLYTYGASDARLPVGSDGQILIADSGETTGQKWADNPGDYFIMALQGGRITTASGQELDFTRGADSGGPPPYPIAAQYTTYDNGGEFPFLVPPNAEVVAVQFALTKGAVGTATKGADPHFNLYYYEIDGDSDTYLGVTSCYVPAANVGVNGDTGTPHYYQTIHKLATPISGFTPGGFLGFRVDLTDNVDNTRIYAVRNLTITLYVRVPNSDILDSGLLPLAAMAKAPAPVPEKSDLEVEGKTETIEGGETVELEVKAADAPGAPALLSLAPIGTTPTSIGKYSVIFDGPNMWCGEFRKSPKTIPPIP